MDSFKNRVRSYAEADGLNGVWTRGYYSRGYYYGDTDSVQSFPMSLAKAGASKIGPWMGLFWAYHTWLDEMSYAGKYSRSDGWGDLETYHAIVAADVANRARSLVRSMALTLWPAPLRTSVFFSGRGRGRRHRKLACQRARGVGMMVGGKGEIVLDAGRKSNAAVSLAFRHGQTSGWMLTVVGGGLGYAIYATASAYFRLAA